MTRQIGAMAIEVMVQDPPPGAIEIEAMSAEVMSEAPSGPVQVDAIALEVMSAPTPPPNPGGGTITWTGKRRRRISFLDLALILIGVTR